MRDCHTMSSVARDIVRLSFAIFLGGVFAGYLWPTEALSQVTPPTVTVLAPDADESTERILNGLRSNLSKNGLDTSFHLVTLSDFVGAEKSALAAVLKDAPKVIVTIGSRATELVTGRVKNIPVVFAGVFHPDASGFVKSMDAPGANVTGASLDILPATQFRYFQQVCPKVKKVGLIYSSATAKVASHARIVAKEAGLELITYEIPSKNGAVNIRELMAAVEKMLNDVDGLWSLADPQIFSPTATKAIIRSALRRRTPIMGFSSHIVESGALFALDFDYKDIGRQAGNSVALILQGEMPAKIPVTQPRIVWFSYNERTASLLSVIIPQELTTIAKEVFK